jgi:nitrite reductase/ring-hydroxylating ferredoxin subunit
MYVIPIKQFIISLSKDKKYNWVKIAEAESELQKQANNMCIAEVDGKKISLAWHNNTLYGFAHKCPHAGGILVDGFIDAVGNVVCPLHRYKFNMQNGRNVTGEGYYLKTYPVQIRAEGVFVGVEEKSLFSFFS